MEKLLTFAYRLLYTPPTCKKKEWIKTNMVIVELISPYVNSTTVVHQTIIHKAIKQMVRSQQCLETSEYFSTIKLCNSATWYRWGGPASNVCPRHCNSQEKGGKKVGRRANSPLVSGGPGRLQRTREKEKQMSWLSLLMFLWTFCSKDRSIDG